MNHPTCETCPFWENETFDDDSSYGQCQRFPPVAPTTNLQQKESIAALGSEGYWKGCFPETSNDDWCGEHPIIKIMVERGDFPPLKQGAKE